MTQRVPDMEFSPSESACGGCHLQNGMVDFDLFFFSGWAFIPARR